MTTRLLIGTWCKEDSSQNCFMRSLIQTIMYFKEQSIDVSVTIINNMRCKSSAKNMIISKFLLNTPFSHLLLVPSDMSWKPEDIHTLLKLDKDCVTIPDIKVKVSETDNTLNCEYPIYTLPDNASEINADQLASVHATHSDFCLLKREALETLVNNKLVNKYKDTDENINSPGQDDYLYDFFRYIYSKTRTDINLIFYNMLVKNNIKVHASLLTQVEHDVMLVLKNSHKLKSDKIVLTVKERDHIEIPHNAKVLSAIYGVIVDGKMDGSKSTNILEPIKLKVSNGDNKFVVTNSLCIEDPAHGVEKVLQVSYAL